MSDRIVHGCCLLVAGVIGFVSWLFLGVVLGILATSVAVIFLARWLSHRISVSNTGHDILNSSQNDRRHHD